MQISQAGLDLITEFEGYHRKLPNGDCVAYRCPANVLTLGFGCTEGITEGMVWTRQQAEDAFRRELVKFEAAVARLVTVEINQNQFDALVSFAFNCGSGALSKSSLLSKLNAGDLEGAARAFAAWNRGGGKVLPGLVRRRAAEAALFQKPAAPSAQPDMPQLVDMPSTKEVHIEAHAELKGTSTAYSVTDKTHAATGLTTIAGGTVAAAFGGAIDAAEKITLTPEGMLNAVGAAAQMVTKYGLPFLGLAFAVVVFCQVAQFYQRKWLT